MQPEPLFSIPLLHFRVHFWHEERSGSLIQLPVRWLESGAAMFLFGILGCSQ